MDVDELATKLEGITPTDLRAAARIIEGTAPVPPPATVVRTGVALVWLPVVAVLGAGLAVLVSALVVGHP